LSSWQLGPDNELQDTIKTMQRTLDAVLRIMAEDRRSRRIPPSRMNSLSASVSPSASGEVLAGFAGLAIGDRDGERFGGQQRRSFKAVVWATVAAGELCQGAGIPLDGGVDKHVRFLERGLDVCAAPGCGSGRKKSGVC
jgi:hypothetical protein